MQQDSLLADDERFMRLALEEAHAAAALGEVPIGAVVVCDDEVIARAHNRRELDGDPSAHAEFSALLEASRKLGRWRLADCTVYVTLEPCLMCAGLMVNARVARCVYGAPDPKAGALGSLYSVHADSRLNHMFEITQGILADECANVLRAFFAERRQARSGMDSAPGAGKSALLQGDAAHVKAFEAAQISGQAGTRSAECSGKVAQSETLLERPRVLLAIDSFKGSATSAQVEEWLAEGIVGACPGAQVTCLPMADGGEGTLDALAPSFGGTFVELEVSGPLGEPVHARYLLNNEAAVIELAEAAGIVYSPCTPEAARAASTCGVGELLRDAVARGARTIYMALGGSATTDGGAGMLQALGARVLDAAGREVPRGLSGLADTARIDLMPAIDALKGCELVILSDVTNPLVGARGAVRVFGPQKGISSDEETLAHADAAMLAYGKALDAARANVLEGLAEQGAGTASGTRRFRSVLSVPGAGAAGGTAAVLLALGARLESGADTVLDLVGFDQAVATADLVITGEGHMDGQTANGKAPVAVARRAKRLHKSVVAVVGGRSGDLGKVYSAGIDLVLPITQEPIPLEQSLTPEQTRANLIAAGETAIRAFLLRDVH